MTIHEEELLADWKLAVRGERLKLNIETLRWVCAMNPRIINVNALENYQLLITFSNGDSGIFDVKPYLDYPVFNRLRDKGFFTLV